MTVPATHRWPDNASLIADVAKLGYLDGRTVLDVTYGRGRFWTLFRPESLVTADLRDLPGVDYPRLDFRDLRPFADASVDVVVLDPPYKLNGTPALGDFDDAYGVHVPARWQDRIELALAGIPEAARVLRPRGRLLYKTQDQVVSGEVRWLTDLATEVAAKHGLRKVDRFDLLGGSRPQPAGRRQVHAQGRPSTLLVFRKAVS